MKLIELEIQHVRGIPYLLLRPQGKNFVIWGPNGSGKSAVVDSIDFLLTGQMSRLTGKGTGEISLNRHGPHIDHKPDEATVRAVLDLPVIGRAEMSRCLKNPSTFECDKELKPALTLFVALAEQGQHVLSRRGILKYITADTGTRAQEIQDLLNITEIEETRKGLVKARNELKRAVKTSAEIVDKAKGAVNATVQEKVFQKSAVLKCINDSRGILGGTQVSDILSSKLKEGLSAPTSSAKGGIVNVDLLETDVQNLVGVSDNVNSEQVGEIEDKLIVQIRGIKSNPEAMSALSRVKLIALGLNLIDDTENCPLCDTPWPAGKLKEYLDIRLASAEAAKVQLSKLEDLSIQIADILNTTESSLQKVIAVAKLAELREQTTYLEKWQDDLRVLSQALKDPLERYPPPGMNESGLRRLMAPEGYEAILNAISMEAKRRYPKSSPQQTAWDILTRLEENLKSLETAKTALDESASAHVKGVILLTRFLKARDKVLGRLYDQIRDRFVELYRQVHGADEGDFAAKMEPRDAGLTFEVDFYSRGTHPPHALHSEGHQDSMGICLYLALAEHLNKGIIDLIILDDVVMSVDSEHRRQVCRLLKAQFPDQQFIITTHDKTWANQLKSEGVVDSRSWVEFYNWNVDLGPQINYETDFWKRIEDDLNKGDVPSAAAKLRRGSEEFFGLVCDAIQAKVPYRLNWRWELGDLLPAAKGQYRRLLKMAKNAAQSWGDLEKFATIGEVDSTVAQIFSRCGAEEWAVNSNVHYNNWANFSKNDFAPVVDAFKDLCGLFVCSKCGGMLQLLTKDRKLEVLCCGCSAVNWSLRPR